MGARPLVARWTERALLHALLLDAERDGVQVVIIQGPAGVGKSHLARAFAEGTAGGPFSSFTVGWREGARLPGEPMHRLAERLLGAAANGRLPWLLDAPIDAVRVEGGWRSAALSSRTIARSLSSALAERPAVVLLEDIHWSDELSRDILSMMLEEMSEDARRFPTLLMLTRRVAVGGSPDEGLIGEMSRSHRTTTLGIDPLPPLDEYALIRAELGGSVSAAIADEIHRRARGVPLEVRAAAAVVLSSRSADDSEQQTLRRIRSPVSRRTVGALTSGWLDTLAPLDRHALGAAAMWGDIVTADSLAAAVGLDDVDARRVMGAGADAGLLEEGVDGYRFAHEQVRAALQSDLSVEDRRALHVRAVDWPGWHDPVQRAEHCLRAGAAIDALRRHEILLAAGRECAVRGAWSDAARFIENALDDELILGLTASHLSSVQFEAGYAHFCNQDIERAGFRLGELVGRQLSPELADLRTAAVLALYRLRITSSRAALRTVEAEGEVRQIAESSRSGSARALASGLLAEAHVMAGDGARALDYGQRAVAEAEQAAGDLEKGRAWFALALAHATTFDERSARDAYARARRHATAAEDALFIGGVDARLPFLALADFDLPSADETSARGLRLARHDANYANQALTLGSQSSVALCRGDFESAVRLAREGLAAAERASYPAAHLLSLVPAVMALGLSGRHDVAGQMLDEWGGRTAGIQALAAALRLYAEQRVLDPIRPPGEPRGPVGVARLLAATEVASRAQDLSALRTFVGDLRELNDKGSLSTPYWPVLVTRVLGEALLALGDADLATDSLRLAIRVAVHRGAATERVRAELALGKALLVEAGNERALACFATAFDLAEQLGMPAAQREAAALLRTAGRSEPPTRDADRAEWRVLVMFDLVDSTATSMRRGDRIYAQLVAQFRSVVRAAVERRRGAIVDTVGDGALAWFAGPDNAEACARAVLDEILLAGTDGLTARCALAAGRPFIIEDRPVGSLVNLVARLCTLAGAGEILANGEQCAWASSPHLYEACGRAALKGIPGDVPVFRLRTM